MKSAIGDCTSSGDDKRRARRHMPLRPAQEPTEGHEAPSVVTGNATVTAPGFTFTVERGIHIENLGGVRVPQNVAGTKDGVDVLAAHPRELRSL